MRLASRLVLAFAASGLACIAGLGLFVREDRGNVETQRFEREADLACTNVRQELMRQGEADRKLVGGACRSGELADRVAVSLERSGESAGMELGWRESVRQERDAFGLDELTLLTVDGRVIGADPPRLADLPRAELATSLSALSGRAGLRSSAPAALVTSCIRPIAARATGVGFLAARDLDPLLRRVSTGLGVIVRAGNPVPVDVDHLERACPVDDGAGTVLPLTVVKDKGELKESLSTLDHAVVSAALVSAALALILAIFLSRQLGRPLAELAAEARKVADGEARPLRVKGSGEIADLVSAFATMLDDLAATRRRLAATDRVAAWREVARRVAHEVKNPLAPIRAAVETLRRLRARDDPAFDEYFDEATRTVLDEVHRIAGIVTEFTRFARLPAPRPTEVDALDLVKTVLRREQARAGAVTLSHETTGDVGPLRADRDQITQILVNLVQNALEALRDTTTPGGGDIRVVLGGDRVHLTMTVEDSGPGIHADFAPRLFEPYATTKSSGTGLGLAIAQRIATDHGGELSFAGTSRLGGAAFRLSLPREGPPIDSERAQRDNAQNNQL